ncbi:Uncharacterised protein [Buttiauxella agrestis]|uniref:DUF4225 domain-containing protein n=1 Tax=Buttiauxella agrestis TaxID=82977 RepID=A0A381CBI6_9ENTR|nr:DUF4225 domain-containing protein [Buttiauxella agrestis]SUW65207.1 Uncharacterised protein [Buttiauxella agrestis]
MEAWKEYLERNPDIKYHLDIDSDVERTNIETFLKKQNELIQVMNDVARKFIQWSIAKDHFVSENIAYSSEINAKINNGDMTVTEAIVAINNEILSLKKQGDELSRNDRRQVIIVKPILDDSKQRRKQENIDLVVAGIGFVAGGLQIASGAALIGSGVGIIPGTLLLANGVNNVIESGCFLLFRESCTGPIRFVYEGIGEIIGLNKQASDVIYTFVDIGISLNGLLAYKLTEEATRLYRYINADLLWGMKQMGMKIMSKKELILEVLGDANTVFGQYRAY